MSGNCAVVRIGTRFGVRLECIHEWSVSEEDDVLLSPLNDFCFLASSGHSIRVGGWGAGAFGVSTVSAARMRRAVRSSLCYDGSCSEDDSDDRPPATRRKKGDVSVATTLMRRMAISRGKSKKSQQVEPKIRKKRRCRNRCMIRKDALVVSKHKRRAHYYDVEIFFQDAEADVQYVWIISFPSRKRSSILPHPHQGLTVENCCGSCKGLFDVDFREIETMMTVRKGVVTTMSGTLSLSAERYQIEFRGVRSMRRFAEDWFDITLKPLEDTSVTSYMLVLKGRVGCSVLLTGGVEGGACCYIAARMQTWCAETLRHVGVCESVELRGIKWSILLGREVAPALAAGFSSVHISRRGGVMMRVLFARRTRWSAAMEDAVVKDGNELLQILRLVLNGKNL